MLAGARLTTPETPRACACAATRYLDVARAVARLQVKHITSAPQPRRQQVGPRLAIADAQPLPATGTAALQRREALAAPVERRAAPTVIAREAQAHRSEPRRIRSHDAAQRPRPPALAEALALADRNDLATRSAPILRAARAIVAGRHAARDSRRRDRTAAGAVGAVGDANAYPVRADRSRLGRLEIVVAARVVRPHGHGAIRTAAPGLDGGAGDRRAGDLIGHVQGHGLTRRGRSGPRQPQERLAPGAVREQDVVAGADRVGTGADRGGDAVAVFDEEGVAAGVEGHALARDGVE